MQSDARKKQTLIIIRKLGGEQSLRGKEMEEGEGEEPQPTASPAPAGESPAQPQDEEQPFSKTAMKGLKGPEEDLLMKKRKKDALMT